MRWRSCGTGLSLKNTGLCSSVPVENPESNGGTSQQEVGGIIFFCHTCSDTSNTACPSSSIGSDVSGPSGPDDGSEAFNPIARRRACCVLKVSRAGPTCGADAQRRAVRYVWQQHGARIKWRLAEGEQVASCTTMTAFNTKSDNSKISRDKIPPTVTRKEAQKSFYMDVYPVYCSEEYSPPSSNHNVLF